MQAGIWNIVIEQGATWNPVVTCYAEDGTTLIDFTGYAAARWTFRKQMGGALWFPQLYVGAGLTLGGAAGTITPLLSAAATAALSPLATPGVHDLEVETAAGIVVRILQGEVRLSREVST